MLRTVWFDMLLLGTIWGWIRFGQVRRLLGVAIGIARGLLPDDYFQVCSEDNIDDSFKLTSQFLTITLII